MIKLGTKVKCNITGFKGTALARIEYYNGCVSYEVQPPAKKDGTLPDPKWIDEQQLVKKSKVKTGGPGHTPPTRSTP